MSTVELKNLKHAAVASEETHCFQATVYIDGKREGTVSNEGTGGPNTYSPSSLQDTLNAIAAKMPPIDMSEYGVREPLPQSDETLIGGIVDRMLEEKQIKRICAKSTYFRKPGETYQLGEWSTLKSPLTPKTVEALVKKYGDQVKIVGHDVFTLK